MFPIKITALATLTAASALAQKGELQAQKSSSDQCVYQDRKGFRCGVGAVFTPEQIAALKAKRIMADGERKSANYLTIGTLADRGIIEVVDQAGNPDKQGLQALVSLQEAHDYSANDKGRLATLPTRINAMLVAEQ